MSVRDPLVCEIFRNYPHFVTRGFLPAQDPLEKFPAGSSMHSLDSIGARLPAALKNPNFRHWAEYIHIPDFRCADMHSEESMRLLRLYYVRTHFFGSGFVNQVKLDSEGNPLPSSQQVQARYLPANIAKAMVTAAAFLGRAPILSYDGYSLYNWKRIDKTKGIELGNLDTIQNFVDLRSAGGVNQESWFILDHIEIEAKAAPILAAIADYAEGAAPLYETLRIIGATVRKINNVLRRIPEHMDPALYGDHFRPYIQGFKSVKYEGCGNPTHRSYRGETGAQSSIMPLLSAFLKIPYKKTDLTEHLNDMLNYMPIEHYALIQAVLRMEVSRDEAPSAEWNEVMDAIAEFRAIHYGWARSYIKDATGDDTGTGGTPYNKWLPQLKKETEDWKK